MRVCRSFEYNFIEAKLLPASAILTGAHSKRCDPTQGSEDHIELYYLVLFWQKGETVLSVSIALLSRFPFCPFSSPDTLPYRD